MLVQEVLLQELSSPSQAVSAMTDPGYPLNQAGFVDISPVLGQYSWGYETCLSGMNCSKTATMSGKTYYYRDNYGYDIKNCTSYAAWRVKQALGVNIPWWGNGGDWDNNQTGYTVDNTPEPGDLAVWDGTTGNPAGHVAFVESVNSDGSVNVSQYNRGGNGEFSYEPNRRALHYIDVNGTGNGISGNPASTPTPTPNGTAEYTSIGEGGEVTNGSWVYTKVGGRLWPIEPKSGWTASDSNYWSGGHAPATISDADVKANEVGYTTTGRVVGANPPGDGTAVYIDGSDGQQYYFRSGRAYPVTAAEVDDLGIRNRAQPIPATGNRLADFTNRNFPLSNRLRYRFAGTAAVRLMAQQNGGGFHSHTVPTDTMLDCLEKIEGGSTIVLPVSARPYVEGGNSVAVLSQPAACEYRSNMVLNGPGGSERWSIKGNGSSQPYTRHYYPSLFSIYMNTTAQPDYQTMRSVAALNNLPVGAQMTMPDKPFRIAETGQVLWMQNGLARPVPNADTLTCSGNPSLFDVPQSVAVNIPQGSPVTCTYEDRLIQGSDGSVYSVDDSRAYHIQNAVILACIKARKNTGNPTPVPLSVSNSYALSPNAAHCPYELQPGINFVREAGTTTVKLVLPGGTYRHVGNLCLTNEARHRVYEVPAGETAGHRKVGDWFADPTLCAALPG